MLWLWHIICLADREIGTVSDNYITSNDVGNSVVRSEDMYSQNRDIRNPGNSHALLLACPSSFPVSSGSYSDCNINGKTSRLFSISSTLTLRSCVFTSCSYGSQNGGCIHAQATTYIYSCTFTSCKTTSTSVKYGSGGAIFVKDSSNSLTVESSKFGSCSAGWCAGTIGLHSAGKSSVKDSSFTRCGARLCGGAIYLQYAAGVTVTGCSFASCTSSQTETNEGGGAIDLRSGTSSITQCSFDSCTAQNAGGAIFVIGAVSGVSATISHCEIIKCTSGKGGGGIAYANGGYYPDSCTVSWVNITECTCNPSYGQAIHIYEIAAFHWDNLCIKGTGTFVKSDVSTIQVPTFQDLIDACPVTNFFTEYPILRSTPRRNFAVYFMFYTVRE